MPGKFMFISSLEGSFPTILNTPTNTDSTSPTTVALGTFNVGDLLIVSGTSTSNNAITVSGGTGWTHATQTKNGNDMTHFTWKVAAGSDTLQLTHSATLSYSVFVVSPGASVTTASSSQGASTSWDFPLVNPGSTKNYLYMMFGHTSVDRSNSPTGWTFYNTIIGASPGKRHIWTKQSTATSEDPANFTDNSTTGGLAKWTVAIHPT